MTSKAPRLTPEPRDGAAGAKLEIRLSEAPASPGPGYQLLAGFQFCNARCGDSLKAHVRLNLPPLEREQVFESWWYRGEVQRRSLGSSSIAECDDYAVVWVQLEELSKGDFRAVTHKAYAQLLEAVKATRHPRIVKVWNYFGNINLGEDDAEVYRLFSLGRAEVFREMGISERLFPTGTAIGTPGSDQLTLVALSTSREVQWVENPRQVSAFHYPRQYGPESPKFSRGGLVTSSGHQLFLTSGTAAVIGHESAFPFDAAKQVPETILNLEALWKSRPVPMANGQQAAVRSKSATRVYIRDPADFPAIAQELESFLGANSDSTVFLHGDICRKELMVEIDGVTIL